jgi:hypothetical protein
MAHTSRYWPTSVMASELTGLRAIVENAMSPAFINPSPLGSQFWVGIRKRTAWEEAIAWLEQRKADKDEWPWPTRAEFDRRRDLGYYGEGDPGYGYA